MNDTEQRQKFIAWIRQKIAMHFRQRGRVIFHEREVWWTGFGENVGSEINGKNYHFERPAIVIRKFSAEILLIVPSTTKQKEGSWYFAYSFERQQLRAVLSQIRVVSSRRFCAEWVPWMYPPSLPSKALCRDFFFHKKRNRSLA